MGTEETTTVVPKRVTLTPKAIIHQKYGNKACYKIEEVKESVQTGCPGLAIPQQGPCLFRCCLELPEISITSEPCTRKKDAEQSAAKMAMEKLGIQSTTNNPTIKEAWDELVSRVSYIFSNEFLPSPHPLTGHLRDALEREGDLHGLVPVSVIAACDQKLNNICKSINHKVESDPLLNMPLILRAAKLSSSVATAEGKLWIWRQNPYSPETMEALINRNSVENIWVEAIRIPCSVEQPVQLVSLNISSNGYYMDVIAEKLGVTDASHVLVSRTIGKSSSEMRLYFSSLELPLKLDSSEDLSHRGETINLRACYFSGQDIYGDAILASIGYTWKCKDLFHEDVTLGTYYRMLVGRLPDGGYKLSRDAIIAAELPIAFTTRTNWRGSFPRDLLCTFCRQHWLPEPEFSTIGISNPTQSPSKKQKTGQKLMASKPAKETEYKNGGTVDANGGESVGFGGTFKCEVKIFSKSQDLIIECSPGDCYRKQSDAIQSAALKVLLWLHKYFKRLDIPIEKWSSSEDVVGIRVYPKIFSKEFAFCLSVHTVQNTSVLRKCSLLGSNCVEQLEINQQYKVCSPNIGGPDSGASPSNGSLVCISYGISLVREGEDMKEPLESSDEFEFEIGTGAVIPQIESCVTQMSINQSACFSTELPHQLLVLAAAGDSAKSLSLLSLKACFLEYSMNLLRVTEPLEDRMEQALFSPPLSKQRVEYALRHINESCATTLVDFGCGSGSLLDSLLDYPTILEKIVGVDISRKSLSRAAKVIHSKLSAKSDLDTPSSSIKSAVLYDGSITVFDSRLYGFDIGTCLEVIEHMEEDEACKFGSVVLSSFCPRILIVSTPNYEYNPILQKSSISNRDEETDEKNSSLPCRFRNHDHKFEWTREQFNCWAFDLASRHNYTVEFSGVGGSADAEPGFASQIAVFRKSLPHQEDQCSTNEDLAHHYEVMWEWNRS
ncbi:RNA-binding protein Lupus La [Macleaya cordata]|uniref:Small RNA 2'-O-methyltransferase n=1 Tax=Macleaya cordata TaxID=56857 RepID=A0A200QC22_MACCD|nr:RNA-binding protein Lupus La [Macleaya cordata]